MLTFPRGVIGFCFLVFRFWFLTRDFGPGTRATPQARNPAAFRASRCERSDWNFGAGNQPIDGPGSHGYDGSCDGLPQPTGTYQTQKVIDYLDGVFNWLDANAATKNIEKWFLYATYRDITTCSSDGYAGLTLFDSPELGANLTPVGEFVRDRVLGVSQ